MDLSNKFSNVNTHRRNLQTENQMFLQTTFLIFVLIGLPMVEPTYKYEYHNVLLNHFAYKEFHLTLPCKSLTTDNLRSGHIVFNLYCERRPFQVKITAPLTETCGKSEEFSSEKPKLYLNIRSHFLDGNELVEFSDPLVPGKKRLISSSESNKIEDGLQSFGQLLTTGSTAILEYTPPGYTQPCNGKEGGDSKFLELEFVLVTNFVPSFLESFKFTKCSALKGFIPTGILCDQYTTDRPLGCPLTLDSDSKNLDPASGQDRQNLDCYQLVLGKENAKAVLELLGETTTTPTSSSEKSTKTFFFAFLTAISSFVLLTFFNLLVIS